MAPLPSVSRSTVSGNRMSDGTVLSAQSAAPPGAVVRRFDLAPHCSLTPYSAAVFLGWLGGTTFAIATFFAIQGFWPVVPFAGLEIGLLAWALRASMRRGTCREVISITEETVTVEWHGPQVDRVSVFPRHWVRVKLHAPLAALHPARLLFESHGRVCEVGRFLTEDERRGLAARLKQLVGNVNESPALR